MIEINDYDRCRESWAKIVAFAKRRHLVPQLARTLERLGRHRSTDRLVELYNDFAPLSMTFTVARYDSENGTWKRDFNGGLIYQGPTDDGEQVCNGSFPTLTVSLAAGTGWFIHT